ncbi:putative HAF family extracellular repeat protein [Paucibacter oligotrophus]|uniref:Putative HAF family extracellular repeat protein n=1 Tax=Roseateles oligotrophus TaxID=1769250 RepID=A0A840L8N1_9BURK|nr:PEP-CTERM sorting domain-containing protein [Roseateles oligotrophus]MBB4842499.1 putative HAF family extracellular repeat protein [Roseateles oligotrophus]
MQLNLSAGALVLVAAGWLHPAQAQPRYSLTPLGELGGGYVQAQGLNDAGQVVGIARLASGDYRAFSYTALSGISELPTLAGQESGALGIASNGLVTGYMGLHAFVYEAGVARSFGPEGLSPLAINAQGSVLAMYGNAMRLYERSGNFVTLPTLGGSSNFSLGAINDQGVVVGQSRMLGDLYTRAFSYEHGVMRNLGTLGGSFSAATAINNAGLIVGTSTQADGSNRAFVYSDGLMRGLATQAGGTQATALSSKGVVGGWSNTGAVIWTNDGNTLASLNGLAPAGWNFVSVVGITAADQVLVNGSFNGQQQAMMIALHPDWQGGDGRWDDATHWNYSGLGSLGHAPGQTQDVQIYAGSGSATVLGAAEGRAGSLSLGAAPGQQLLFKLNGGSTRSQAGTLMGAGAVLGGSGRLEGGLTVQPGAVVQVGAGESMSLSGGPVLLKGVMKLQGNAAAAASLGSAAAVSSAAGSQIQVQSGNLEFAGGLSLGGRLGFSYGISNVSGPVQVLAGGQLLMSGNSSSSFNDGVEVLAGGELRVSQGSSATFFGQVLQRNGAVFSGTGQKFFEGGLSIGGSPGLGVDEGSVSLGGANVYLAEIGGASACTLACTNDESLRNRSFDKYLVMGQLSFGGTLKLVSWQGFSAHAGQSFDLFDWGGSSGSFALLDSSGFAHDAGTVLDFSRLYTTGEIRVLAVPEPASLGLFLLGLLGLGARRLQSK